MGPLSAWIRARLPLCIVAACGLHVAVASALPRNKRTHATLADAPASPLDIDNEDPTTPASDDHAADRAATSSPAPSPEPRAHKAAPAPKETVVNPIDSTSDSTEPSTGNDGWAADDGANGSGTGARGGRAGDSAGKHDHHAGHAGGGKAAGGHHVGGHASLDVGRDWSDCPFPKSAQRKNAFVRIVVVVDAKGDALDVKVLSDPGEGFGESAASCAKRRHYVAGTNDVGDKEQTETEPFLVYFTR